MSASPKLQILVGPPGSGKTASALAEYRGVLCSGPILSRRRALWLAPTQAAANGVRESLLAGEPAAMLDPGVTTFAGFASSVVWDAGRRMRVLSALQRRRVWRQVIADAAANGTLTYFGRVAGSPGLLNLVDEAIAGLKRRDISAEAFSNAYGRPTPRRQELAELYSRYEARLRAAELVDAEGLLLAARDGLRAANEVATGLELVVVDGFTDFTTAQLEMLELLIERARRVLVTLVAEESGGRSQESGVRGRESGVREDLFAKTRATYETLKRMGAADVSILKPQASSLKPSERWPAMAHLERNLFRSYRDVEAAPSAVKASLDRVHIVAASSVQAEIDQIARRVKELLVARTPPGEVVVAFRWTRDVADRVRQAFDDFGIPLYLDAPRRLNATPLVRSLMNVLRLHAEDWPYRRLLQAAGDRSLCVGENRAAVELCVRHAQLPSSRQSLLEQVAAWAADAERFSEPTAQTAIAASPWLTRFAAWLDELPQRADLAKWIVDVERLAVRLGLLTDGYHVNGATPLPIPPRQGEGTGNLIENWTALAGGLRAIGHIDGATGRGEIELSLAEFVDLVATTAAELSAPEDRDAIGRVRVLSAEAARFVRPRHLFVGGLSEQSFPAGVRSEQRGQEDEDDSDAQTVERDAHTGEMLLFYQLVTRPTETLTLSYPALDAKGQSMPPSPYLVELQRSFRGADVPQTVQSLAYAPQPRGAPLSRSELRRSAVAAAQERKRDLLATLARSPRYAELGRSMLDGVEAVASRADRRQFGAFEGVFASDAVKAVLERQYGPEYFWSPSMLETYAGCPFRFFGEQILHLAPLPELALESDLARRGSLLHDTLARLYGRLSAAAAEGGAPPTPEAVAARFQETLDAIVASRPRRGLDAVLREIERRQIASWAAQFAEQHRQYSAAWPNLDSPLQPKYFEARFGPKNRRSESLDDDSLSTEEPFVLTIGREQFKFTGQIDRIDVGRVDQSLVFNVIDYKTGANNKVDLNKIESGAQLQLPLYAMAVAELLLADQKAAPLSAGYWSILGKGFGVGARGGGPLAIGEIRDGRVQMAAAWTSLREKLLARIAEIVTGIRHGWFPVYSDDKDCTKTCSLSTTCRIAHVRSLEKEWSPPEASL